MEPKGSIPRLQEPTTFPYPEPDQCSPCLHIPRPEDPSTPGPSKWSLSLKFPCMHLSSSPYVLHASLISFFWIWSPE